jgi:Leucine-rich repeat (LRR) protein
LEVFSADEHLDDDEKFWEIVPITRIDLSHNAIPVLPEDIERYAESLEQLRLRENQLQALPRGLYKCNQLKHLDISMNSLVDLQSEIGNLTELRELIAFDNSLKQIPPTLTSCERLHTLELQNNRIDAFLTEGPDAARMQRLHNLSRLILSSNRLHMLPNSFAEMTSLTFLDLKKNQLESLPSFKAMNRLTYLDISQNSLESFPQLPTDSSLDRLHMNNNRIKSINLAELLNLKDSLTELHIHDNQLSEIPYDIGLMRCMKLLDVCNNNVNDLPASLGWIDSLNRLAVDGNPIRSIRRTLLSSTTQGLKAYLKTRGPAAGVDLSALDACRGVNGDLLPTVADPFDIEGLPSAEKEFIGRVRDVANGRLNMSAMQLTLLSEGFTRSLHASHLLDGATGTVTCIVDLDLSGNHLRVLPCRFLSHLACLAILNVSGNKLGSCELADVLTECTGLSTPMPPTLRRIDLSRNQLSSAHMRLIIKFLQDSSSPIAECIATNNVLDVLPPELSEFTHLRELNVGSNRISSVDNIEFARLASLEILDLSGNQMVDVRPLASGCDALRSLNLENNNIAQVPAEFALLPKLTYIGLYGNPQKTIRMNMLGNTDTVLKTLRNRLPPEALARQGEAGGVRKMNTSVQTRAPPAVPAESKNENESDAKEAEVQAEEMRREIARLEKELEDNLSMTVMKKSQIRRMLVAKRSALSKLR